MPLNPKVLRRLFAVGAVVVVLIVASVYLRGVLQGQRLIRNRPKNIPAEVAQSTQGFSLSQARGGRTLFTIHASRAEQFKQGGRSELHDVNIVVYGRDSNRFDQIYGSDFIYDPESGDVTAQGDVHIDLESDAGGSSRPDQSPPQEIKNPIHLKTSNLTFNRKTGMAQTKERIEFRTPEASGSAVGAKYDSHQSVLELLSGVHVISTQKDQVSITAQGATISKDPRRAVLREARMEEPQRLIRADSVTLLMRDDNTIDRVQASGNVHAKTTGEKAMEVNAPQAEFLMADREMVRSGTLSGGVTFESQGSSPAQGKAGRVLLTFGGHNRLLKARAEQAVDLHQGAAQGGGTQGSQDKAMELHSEGVDLFLINGKTLDKAVTSGPSQIVIDQKESATNITAGQFHATFNAQNRLKSVVGGPDAKVVSSTPGQPDQITTSHELIATFNDDGTIHQVEQAGNFHYQQGQRIATADRARYALSEENVVMSGSPRVQDTGMSLTAQTIQMNRKTGLLNAQDEVKTTYSELKPQAGGAMLSSSDPIHVTGSSMQASRSADTARFANARLWQGQNIVEAPTISFDKGRRSLQAQSSPQGRVSCVFVEPDKKTGKTTPVNVTADKLSYVDADRKAVFSGNVVVRGAQISMTAETVQALLLTRGAQTTSQLDRIIANGDINIQQADRKATGNQLVYTPQEGKVVLTASKGKRPSIFDAEHGQISGDSLTFFTHDDRVLVDSSESSHTQIQTRIRDASKK
jgi:lipopolysaccharide export system protein LptA